MLADRNITIVVSSIILSNYVIKALNSTVSLMGDFGSYFLLFVITCVLDSFIILYFNISTPKLREKIQ